MSDLLEVQGLSKSFGGLKAVGDLSFSVAQGEILGIIGPNGAGKTTAINLVSGVYRPDSGRVLFAGEDVTALAPYRLARKGLVRTFQAAVSYRDSDVWENAVRGAFLHQYPGFWHTFFDTSKARQMRREAEERVRELLTWLGMDQVRDSLASSLPYGYQKTLGLVVALAARPRLVMLDEPAAGLSAEETDQVRQVIQQINRSGVSVVVIDHNVRFMKELCHRMIVVTYGTKLAQGTPDEVMSDPQVIEAYLGKGYGRAEVS